MQRNESIPMQVQNQRQSQPLFYGWWIVAAAFLTLGLAVGLPYFGMTFFYDYFEKPIAEGGFGWSRTTITFGLPLGTLVTLWVGPLLAPRFSPRALILVGTGLTAFTLISFGRLNGNVWLYWLLWLVYMTGNVFSGVLTHQVILSNWFVKRRGLALAIAYLGISVIGALSARLIAQPLTATFGFRAALQIMGGLVLLSWPFVLFVFRDRPAERNLWPDGEVDHRQPAPEAQPVAALPFTQILRDRLFWLLLLGGSFSAGAIGAISQHLKLFLKDSGFTNQQVLDDVFSQTLLIVLITSAVGRLIIGQMSDRLPKKLAVTLAFLPLLAAFPLLFWVEAPAIPMLFALCFGLATGGDFLLTALMAGDRYSVAALPSVLAILLPVMTVGQTWFPYLVALLREQFGTYQLPMSLAFGMAVASWLCLLALPTKRPAGH